MSPAEQKKLTDQTTAEATKKFSAEYQAQMMQKLIEQAKK